VKSYKRKSVHFCRSYPENKSGLLF